MMSSRLTFSLASLFLIFALGFAAMPVMAAVDGPTVDITQGMSKTRAAFDLNFEFSHPVEAAGSSSQTLDYTWRLVDAQTNLLGSNATSGTATQKANSRTEYTATIDITGNTDNVNAVKVIVSVAADVKTGTTTSNILGNQAGRNEFTLPPVQGDTTVRVTQKAHDDETPGKYTITFTFSADTSPAFTQANISTPTTGVTLVDASFATVTAETVYTVDAQLVFGASGIMIGVDPGYAKPASAGSNMVTLPPPVTATQNDPAAMITVSGHNPVERTFRIDVKFTPAADSLGNAGAAIKGFNKDGLDIKDASTPPADVLFTVETDRESDNSYIAILKYDLLSTLPLTIKIDQSEQKTSNPNHSGMVGESAPPPEDDDPTAEIAVSGVDVSERTFTVEVALTPGMKADGSAGDPITGFGLDDLEIMGQNDSTPRITAVDEDMANNSYLAKLQWNPLATRNLPFTVKAILDDSGADPVYYMDTSDPAMAAMATISSDGTTPPVDPTVDPPAMPAAPSASINANNDLIIDVMWTAVTGADEYIIKKYMGTTLVKTFPDDDPNTAMITASPYMVGPVPAADRGMSFTFTVTAKNAGGLSAPSPVSAAVMVPAAPPATTNNAPTFATGASIPEIIIWQGHAYVTGTLPKARDNEGDDISYAIEPDLPAGFELLADDSEDRVIEVREANKADTVVMKAADYAFVAEDQHGAKSDPVKFKITVLAPIKPTAPTGVTAMEEGDLGFPNNVVRRTVNTNKVVVNFVAPVDTTKTSHNPAIPFGAPITGYKVYRKLAQSSTTYDHNKADSTSFTTPVLDRGMHMFEVAAVNSVGDGAKSTPAAEALVADPPGQATDLRASKVPTDPNSVTLDWLKPADDGGADVLGYFIYHTLDGASLPDVEIGDVESNQIKGLDAGRHVFRVAGFNSDGLGSKSISTEFSVDVPLDPTNAAPTFGTQSISAITATEGMPIEGITLPAATDPDGDAITYSIKEMSQLNGLTFNKETRFLSGTPTKAMASKVYTYQASDGKGKTASLNFTISVAAKYTPPQVDDGHLTATFAEGTGSVVGTTTIGGTAQAGVMIAGHGFATVGANDLTDLQEFLELGGTIGLSNGDAIDDKNSRTVVISEILWGLDFGASVDDQTQWQFIELYNTTNAAINLTGWTLTFTEGRPVPASDIDRFSNRSGTGWNLGATHGQSGRVTGTTAVDVDNTVTPVRITSMYRDINYDKVETEAAKATVNRGELVKGIPGGDGSGSWKASQRRSEYNRWIYDSRWDKHFKSTAILTASAVARTPFIINEVGNGSDDTNDWVEIRNVTGSEASLKNYHLSVVTGFDTDTSLVNFHDKDIKVPGNSVILLVNTDPKNTGIAAGRNAAVAEADQELTGVTSRYYINSSLKLPNSGKFNLILRKSSHFMDVIGGLVVADATKGTSLWPLVATGAPHGDVVEANGRDLKSGFVYIRKNAGGGTGEHHLGRAGYTGVGYDRDAPKSDANGGTPGYANDALKEKVADLSSAEITISEVMVDTGDLNTGLPQWIEIYNSSMTQAVNLNGWKLMIENSADAEVSTFNATLTLDAMTISPNQTVLIVSTSGRTSDTDQFPSTRVVNLWVTKKHREELEMTRRTDQVLSTKGFHLKLVDKDNKTVDMVGNLDGNRRTRDEPTWVLPMSEEEGRRSSLIRRYDDHIAGDGEISDGWVLASDTNLAHSISHTYYGNADDYGTPGYRGGGPLPVSLSKFRPERLDDGTIVVQWITESELNNAGFNILRSETRDGEFTQINTKMIAGKGTTSERTTYAFPDTSAKPNVVYYYQIQDVSLDGKVTTLRQSRLKGHVSAAGKLTTTWGELKSLQ